MKIYDLEVHGTSEIVYYFENENCTEFFVYKTNNEIIIPINTEYEFSQGYLTFYRLKNNLVEVVMLEIDIETQSVVS